MLGKLFKKQAEEETLLAPAKGKAVAIESVPDPTFSEKMMGDGVAIEPTEGKITAPVDSEVVQVFPTKHAVGLKTKSGVEILIHIGLETVSMDGEGFEAHVENGQKVKAGDTLVTFDLDLVKERAASTITPVVITNVDQVDILEKNTDVDNVTADSTVMTVKAK